MSDKTKTKVRLMKASPEELRFFEMIVDLSESLFETFQSQIGFQNNFFDLAQGAFDQLGQRQALQGEAFTPEQQLQLLQEQFQLEASLAPLQSQILQSQAAFIQSGGAASPEQRRLLEEAANRQIETGVSDIEASAKRGLTILREQLSPQLGLRPTDTPIVDRGGEITKESLRLQSNLISDIRGRQAEAELELPLATQQLQLGQFGQAQAAQQFGQRLPFNQQLGLLGAAGQGGLALTQGGLGPIGQALNLARAPRFAQPTTTTTLAPSQTFGNVARGLGELDFCWIAAEYFGWLSPKWFSARWWIFEGWEGRISNVFRRIYIRHGRRIAQWVDESTIIRFMLRPVFEWAARKGESHASC